MNGHRGKRVLVTGGAQGIGRAVCRAFLDAGARVAFLDRDGEAVAETEADLGGGEHVLGLVADVSDEARVNTAVDQVVRALGGLDVLVNNAGIMIRCPLEDLSLADWNRVLGVNLTGAFLCTRRAAPHLREVRGCVVNIASTRAFQSEPDTEAYAASKGGLVSLTHALAVSLGPEVRVNCIAPGWIDVTGLATASVRRPVELTPEDHAQHPAGRVGRPGDVASLVLYLASGQAGFLTGACLTLDGGMTRRMIYRD